MKPTLALLTALLLAPLAALFAADAPTKPKPALPPKFAAITGSSVTAKQVADMIRAALPKDAK